MGWGGELVWGGHHVGRPGSTCNTINACVRTVSAASAPAEAFRCAAPSLPARRATRRSRAAAESAPRRHEAWRHMHGPPRTLQRRAAAAAGAAVAAKAAAVARRLCAAHRSVDGMLPHTSAALDAHMPARPLARKLPREQTPAGAQRPRV
eukprot:311957-Chlamydomonas_euryale.AAC.2